MGIELRLRPYCDECPNFKPMILNSWDMTTKKNVKAVVCESMNLCGNMERYIRNRIKNENEKQTDKESN